MFEGHFAQKVAEFPTASEAYAFCRAWGGVGSPFCVAFPSGSPENYASHWQPNYVVYWEGNCES